MKRSLTSIFILSFSCFFLWGCRGNNETEKMEQTKASIENNDTVENTEGIAEDTTGTKNNTILYETKEELKDNYFVLRKEDGTIMAYNAEQTQINNESDVTVQVTGWISTTVLGDAAYDVYVSLGGIIYNTGYKVELAK